MKISTPDDPRWRVFARDIITQCLGEVVAAANTMPDGTVLVIAPVIPGTPYPDLDYQWTIERLHKSTETVWWQEDIAAMNHTNLSTQQSEPTPGLSHWIGTITYADALVMWPQWDLSEYSFEGVPVIIHMTTMTTEMSDHDVAPFLADFTP